jgi:hypothetical protein
LNGRSSSSAALRICIIPSASPQAIYAPVGETAEDVMYDSTSSYRL